MLPAYIVNKSGLVDNKCSCSCENSHFETPFNTMMTWPMQTAISSEVAYTTGGSYKYKTLRKTSQQLLYCLP